jgi:hypothetical protein
MASVTYNKTMKYAPTPIGVSAGHFTAAREMCVISFSHISRSYVKCRLL